MSEIINTQYRHTELVLLGLAGLVWAGENMLEESVDSKIDIAVVPSRHFIETKDVVILHPTCVLSTGYVDVLHVALVAHQDDRFNWLVSELHSINIILQPGRSTQESFSSEQQIIFKSDFNFGIWENIYFGQKVYYISTWLGRRWRALRWNICSKRWSSLRTFHFPEPQIAQVLKISNCGLLAI